MAASPLHLLPELAQIVHEYEGDFRVKESKIDIWINDKRIEKSLKDASIHESKRRAIEKMNSWQLLGSYNVTPGMWRATIGPYTYILGVTLMPFIIHKNDFDLNQLPPVSHRVQFNRTSNTATNIVISASSRRTDEECKSIARYEIGEGSSANPLSFSIHVSENTYIANGEAIVLILMRHHRLESKLLQSILRYNREVMYSIPLKKLRERLSNYRVSHHKGSLLIQPLKGLDKEFPDLHHKMDAYNIIGFNVDGENKVALGNRVGSHEPKWKESVSLEDVVRNSPIREFIMNAIAAVRFGDRIIQTKMGGIERNSPLARGYAHIMEELEGSKLNSDDRIDIKDDGSYVIVKK